MYKKVVVLLVLLGILLGINIAAGETTIGVKTGDWIEYSITTTGTPPDEKNIVWARMEILEIQGNTFRTNTTGRAPNGTLSSYERTFNFPEGEVSAWIIIPANLGSGDSFYDSFEGRNFTIDGEEQKTIAGATRTTTYIDVPGRFKRWDKSTGVFVETIDDLGNFTVNATVLATNMWSPQIAGMDQTLFYGVVIAVVIAVVVLVIIFVASRRKK
jgi:hypothetical protein